MVSILCDIMKRETNWKEYMSQNYPDITIKDYIDKDPGCPYVLFMYGIGCDFSDPVVQESRGIIIDENKKEVVCFPFRKFGKYYESYADEIDWSTARVQEKLDGSIIKLWYSEYYGKWIWSTNSMINARDAYITETLTIFDIIMQCINISKIKVSIEDNKLNKDLTYIFELTSPFNQVVVRYDFAMLHHIGTRNNKTGEELNIDIGIEKPLEYNLHSLDDCIKFLDNLDNGVATGCEHEGFVVVDAKWNRIKVKNPIYQIIHNILNNGKLSKSLLISFILDGKISINDISEEFPDLAHWFKYYDYKVSEFLYQANAFIDIVRKIYDMSNGDRKIVAVVIKNHHLSSIGFKAIGNELSLKEILDNTKKGYHKSVESFIPNYEPENMSYLFEECKRML